MSEQSNEPRELNPYFQIKHGEDAVDSDDNVIFSDFRPVPVDASTEETPKGESAPESVDSSGSQMKTEQVESETPAPNEKSTKLENSTDADSETKKADGNSTPAS